MSHKRRDVDTNRAVVFGGRGGKEHMSGLMLVKAEPLHMNSEKT